MKAEVVAVAFWRFLFHFATHEILAHRNRSDFCDFCDCDTHRGPQKSLAVSETLHCDLGVRWGVASDVRFPVAISEPETPSFCGIPGDLAPSTRKSLAIAIMRFWRAKHEMEDPLASPQTTRTTDCVNTFYFSHRPSPLLRGRRMLGSWAGSVLCRFSVGHSWPKLTKNWPRIDPKSTPWKVFDRSVGFMTGDSLWLT